MKVLLLDITNILILFKPDHILDRECFAIVEGHQWFIWFMTHSELLLWPRVNRWGSRKHEELMGHINLCTTLLPDEETCVASADIMAESRTAGRPVTAADAWVAAAARQWDLALVTALPRLR